MLTASIQLPAKLEPLRHPARYKVAYGGRAGMKSWGFARQLLIDGATRTLRVLCTREVQLSIKDSVHKLLSDQIEELGLGDRYDIMQTEIRGKNGTEFIFAGLSTQTVESIKSYEGIDICWVEEAQKVRKRSWGILIPTIRKPGSEIWVSFNPDLDTDDTYQRFIVNTPPGAVLIPISFRDNPWLSVELQHEIEHLRKTDQDEYETVWEGRCRPAVAGAIYHKELAAAHANGRIRNVPYDPMLKVHTIWDLGWNDKMFIILAQRAASEIRVIRAICDSHKRYDEYVEDYLKPLKYNWGKDFLPHDGNAKNPQTGMSAKQVLKKLGRDVDSVGIPKLDPESGIRMARQMFPRVYFDKDAAFTLIDSLKRYKRSIPMTTDEPASPVHDDASHGADAYRGMAQIESKMRNDEQPTEIRIEEVIA